MNLNKRLVKYIAEMAVEGSCTEVGNDVGLLLVSFNVSRS